MTPVFQIRPNPVRFLLLIECLMLVSCGSLAVIETFEKGQLPIQHILVLISLGLMGWLFPTGRNWAKILYTVIEMSLIFYGTLLGYLHILPSLYLIVVIRSCFIFDILGRMIVAVISLSLFLVHKINFVQRLTSIMNNTDAIRQIWAHQFAEILMFAIGLFFVLQFVSTWLLEKSSRQQLAGANNSLRDYALKVEDLAAVNERNRIARDIHDSLGHSLTALNVQLQTAIKLWDIRPNEVRPFLDQAKRLGEIAIGEVRKSVYALRVDEHREEALGKAIENLVEDFRQSTGIECKTDVVIPPNLSPRIVKTIYRIIQEALTNICKHANANNVQINLQENGVRIYLLIEDDGCGFSVNTQNGFGLQGMKERVSSVHGKLTIDSQSNNGCRVVAELPIE